MSPYIAMSSGRHLKVADFVTPGMRKAGDTTWNTLAFWDSRGLKVGLVYDGMPGSNIGMHIRARPGALWCHPKILYHIFAFPFKQLGTRRVTAPIEDGNEASVRTVQKLGFQLEGRLRKAATSGKDVLLYGMLREECRWLNFVEAARAQTA